MTTLSPTAKKNVTALKWALKTAQAKLVEDQDDPNCQWAVGLFDDDPDGTPKGGNKMLALLMDPNKLKTLPTEFLYLDGDDGGEEKVANLPKLVRAVDKNSDAKRSLANRWKVKKSKQAKKEADKNSADAAPAAAPPAGPPAAPPAAPTNPCVMGLIETTNKSEWSPTAKARAFGVILSVDQTTRNTDSHQKNIETFGSMVKDNKDRMDADKVETEEKMQEFAAIAKEATMRSTVKKQQEEAAKEKQAAAVRAVGKTNLFGSDDEEDDGDKTMPAEKQAGTKTAGLLDNNEADESFESFETAEGDLSMDDETGGDRNESPVDQEGMDASPTSPKSARSSRGKSNAKETAGSSSKKRKGETSSAVSKKKKVSADDTSVASSVGMASKVNKKKTPGGTMGSTGRPPRPPMSSGAKALTSGGTKQASSKKNSSPATEDAYLGATRNSPMRRSGRTASTAKGRVTRSDAVRNPSPEPVAVPDPVAVPRGLGDETGPLLPVGDGITKFAKKKISDYPKKGNGEKQTQEAFLNERDPNNAPGGIIKLYVWDTHTLKHVLTNFPAKKVTEEDITLLQANGYFREEGEETWKNEHDFPVANGTVCYGTKKWVEFCKTLL